MNSDVGENRYSNVLLPACHLDYETSLGAVEHVKRMEFVLSVFKKDHSHVVAMVGDNISTNNLVADRMGCVFV